MWFTMAEVEKMTRKSAAQLKKAMVSGQLNGRITEQGELEIELSSILRAFAGEQVGASGIDEISQRIDKEWSVLWHRSDTC
ncbi:hypothetical protein COO59_03815 [Mixta theicola]|uniref:Uncharacterized protein n=1 Tax=Mixta theicola TaxID=1458355 RepID=A0A2K1QDF2_9GAMM|nr:hypothetical protein [Mixta theicola]PNS13050.1 hypothetical protein COO59_03815 [Mixta theicola]GLR09312.1 hypothetical protein GCM10007905_20320 [Mixta theicola]